MKPKHLPAVIDDAVQACPSVLRNRSDYAEVARLAPQAHRFIFSDEASVRLGEIIGLVDDLIVEHHQFAIPPFPCTYIEVNMRLMHAATGRKDKVDHEPADERDERTGWLLDNGRWWGFCRSIKGPALLTGFRYEDNLGNPTMPWPEHLSPIAKGLGPNLGRLAIYLGGPTVLRITDKMDAMEELLARITLHPCYYTFPYNDWIMWEAASGDVLYILSALLVLGLPKHVVQAAEQPRYRALYKGRSMVFHSHRTITITLGESKHAIRRLFTHPTGIHHKRHDVKGHWMHIHLKVGCDHDWPRYPELPENDEEGGPSWRCGLCGGIRTWRKHHERGDASLGRVTHDYAVKIKGEKDND